MSYALICTKVILEDEDIGKLRRVGKSITSQFGVEEGLDIVDKSSGKVVLRWELGMGWLKPEVIEVEGGEEE
ncbi:MAG: hypothetical protein EOM01_14485 [Spirochaetia bacterium]|nr:hypothetical protein [Spirochaetia bacterium]